MKNKLSRIVVAMLIACLAVVAVPLCAFGVGDPATSNTQASSTAQSSVASASVSDVDMALVFDVSGSMDTYSANSGVTKLQAAKNQVQAFVTKVKPEDIGGSNASVRAGVVSFADDGKVVSDLSGDRDEVSSAIESMTTGEMTNIYAGLELGIEMLESSQAAAKILVLLSDGENNEGHTNDEVRALAAQAKSAGIVIYTIGFGPASELDEDLLKYLADQTGGMYSHEDSSDIYSATLGIFATMMQAQMTASGQTIIAQTTGAVSQGQTVSVDDIVMSEQGTLVTYLYWPGSVLTMKFVDPNNVEVTPSYPGYTVDDSSIPTKITIQNAVAGTWKASVTGEDVSMKQEPFYTVSSFIPTVAVASGGGGGPVNGGMIFVFIIAIVGIGAVLLTYAMAKRKSN